MQLPSNGIRKFDGIDDLRRLVREPRRVLDDAEQAHVSNLVDELEDSDVPMPFDYGALDLGSALAGSPRNANDARSEAQVLAAWDVRFGIDPSDPVTQAAIGARIDELVAGAPATLESQRGIAELRTLVSVSRDYAQLPEQLGIYTHTEFDDVLRWRIASPLVRDGKLDAPAHDFIDRWQLTRDPAKLQAWQATVDDAARGRAPLPADASIELLLSPASKWHERSSAQRMRLLDALASAGDGPMTTVRARTRNARNYVEVNDPDVKRHLGQQVARALRGEAPLPTGITTRDIVESWHYRRAAPDARRALLEQHARAGARPILDEYAELRDQLDLSALAVGRDQADDLVRRSLATGDPLPEWIEVGDVLTSSVTDRQKARLLSRHLSDAPASTPEEAAAQLVTARIGLTSKHLGGDVAGVESMRLDTLRLIEQNLGRIDGRVADGYEGHPDYAAVGRVQTNMRMLDRFESTSRDRAATAQATTGAGHLTW